MKITRAEDLRVGDLIEFRRDGRHGPVTWRSMVLKPARNHGTSWNIGNVTCEVLLLYCKSPENTFTSERLENASILGLEIVSRIE